MSEADWSLDQLQCQSE